MKKNWRNKIALSLLALLLLFAAACNTNSDNAEHKDTYICPMHPTVVSDRPATCPVCGMDLVRKARAGEEVEITEALARLIKSPNETVMSSIKTIRGEYKSMPLSIEAQGIVTYDTRNIYTIPARIGGRLEKVFVKYEFQRVKKGQKVAEIYSPELLTAQRELLFLIENDAENKSLIESAKDRLRLLGATEAQIVNLINKKEPQSTFAIHSPYDGYVISDTQGPRAALPAVNPSSTANGGGMNDGMGTGMPAAPMAEQAPSNLSSSAALIREGSYVSVGETLFKIVNASALRVEIKVPGAVAKSISRGEKATLDFGGGDIRSATVDFIQPFFDQGQELATLRVYTKSTESLHIGGLVRATIKSVSDESMWVPKEAVLDLGLDKVVFIKDKGSLKPKKVIVGSMANDAIEIRQGLSSADEIAANAQYLVDSESFIKTQN